MARLEGVVRRVEQHPPPREAREAVGVVVDEHVRSQDVVRERPGEKYVFVLNHGADAGRVRLGAAGGLDLVSGRKVRGVVSVPPRGVMVVRRPAAH